MILDWTQPKHVSNVPGYTEAKQSTDWKVRYNEPFRISRAYHLIWKAWKVGTDRVVIKKFIGGVHIKVEVSLRGVEISMNGTLTLGYHELEELNAAIEEARAAL